MTVVDLELEEKAWLACAIDSEGSIVVSRNSSHIVVYNTHKGFVDRAASLIEAKPGVSWGNGYGRKPIYHASIAKRKTVKRILNEIMPFLIVKRQQAELALEWIDSRPVQDTRRPGRPKKLQNLLDLYDMES